MKTDKWDNFWDKFFLRHGQISCKGELDWLIFWLILYCCWTLAIFSVIVLVIVLAKLFVFSTFLRSYYLFIYNFFFALRAKCERLKNVPFVLWHEYPSFLHEQTLRNLRCKFTNAEEGREYTQMLILMFIEHSKWMTEVFAGLGCRIISDWRYKFNTIINGTWFQ